MSNATYTGPLPIGDKSIPFSKRAADARAAVGTATAVHTERRKASDEATETAETLRSRLRGGDASVSGADLLSADAEVERATLLSAAAERSLTVARRGVLNEDTSLAEALTGVLTDAYGIAPVVTPEAPAEVASGDLPALYAVQTRQSERIESGALRGGVRLLLHRTRVHRTLDVEALEQAAGRAFIEPVFLGTTQEDGHEVDEVHLDVGTVYEDLFAPQEDGRAGEHVRDFLRGGLLRDAFTNPVSTSATVSADAARLLSDQTDDDGVRRRTFEAEVRVKSKGTPWTAQEAGDLIATIVDEDMPGAVVSYVGRVEDASWSNMQPTSFTGVTSLSGAPITSGRRATVRLVVASRQS